MIPSEPIFWACHHHRQISWKNMRANSDAFHPLRSPLHFDLICFTWFGQISLHDSFSMSTGWAVCSYLMRGGDINYSSATFCYTWFRFVVRLCVCACACVFCGIHLCIYIHFIPLCVIFNSLYVLSCDICPLPWYVLTCPLCTPRFTSSPIQQHVYKCIYLKSLTSGSVCLIVSLRYECGMVYRWALMN